MTRSELLAILTELVRRNAITIEEAQLVLNRFDAGDLEDVPLPSSADGLLSGTHDDWIAALALVLVMMSGSPGRTLTAMERKKVQKLLRNQFEASTTRLGFGVVGGAIAITTWQKGMQTALSNYSRQMAVAGAGKMPSVVTQSVIEEKLAEQWSYLQRFATQIMARQVVARPMSEPWIIQRARRYGGPTGWASYFIGQGGEESPGYVDVWLTRDDPNVCYICSPRHQRYFLPTQGPWPGDFGQCLGDCRCVRKPEYLPDVYADLTGQRSSQIHPVRERQLAEAAQREAIDKQIADRVRARGHLL